MMIYVMLIIIDVTYKRSSLYKLVLNIDTTLSNYR